MSLIFQLGTTSSDAITLRPEFDYQERKLQIKNSLRTVSRRGFNYIFSDYKRFDMSVDYVSGNNASIINSWWESDTKLLLYKAIEISGGFLLVESGGGFFLLEDGGFVELESPGYSTEVFSVYITNRETPLRQFRKPYNNYYKGSIQLESY